MLNNLISNALRFTKKGSVRFGYKIQNGELLFYVKDTGIGIKKEKRQIIFDRSRF